MAIGIHVVLRENKGELKLFSPTVLLFGMKKEKTKKKYLRPSLVDVDD